jgi:hypothetical protein
LPTATEPKTPSASSAAGRSSTCHGTSHRPGSRPRGRTTGRRPPAVPRRRRGGR